MSNRDIMKAIKANRQRRHYDLPRKIIKMASILLTSRTTFVKIWKYDENKGRCLLYQS